MIIEVNSVLLDKIENQKLRIIWIDATYDVAYFVKLVGDTAMPIFIKYNHLYDSGEYEMTIDPLERFIVEEDIPKKYRIQRDKDWKIISDICNNYEKELLERSSRNKVIRLFSEEHNVSEKKMKRLLTRFYQRGMNKNALLSDYVKSGAKGKTRTATFKKRGRPRNIPLHSSESTGINVDDKIREIFKMAIKKHYSNRRKAPLTYVYKMMLLEYFSDIQYVDGKPKHLIWEENLIPTYRQFEYWFKKDKDDKEVFIARNSEKEYQLKLRELIGDSNMETFGPGFRYQIDATIADVYLLSSFNRKDIIGRPILYIVVDVYSRLVVGMYVGLEGPSWIGAMLALDNVLEDKVEFCKKYDVEITKEEWPNAYLPETIIADRGEFEGYNVENMINNLNITIENTPPYRGDLKGIVERKFKTYNGKIKYLSPGAIMKEYRKRGDRDYRLDAVFTVEDFTSFMLEMIVDHNTSVIEKYESELGLISNEVPPIPVDIWNWGIEHRRSGFITRDREFIRMNLLPRSKAIITRRGIRFNKAYYSSARALQEQWFTTSSRKSVDIVYDPYNMNSVYVMIKEKNQVQFEECLLVEKNERKYKDISFNELRFINELEKELVNAARKETLSKSVNSTAKLIEIAKKAEKKVSTTNKSDKERLKNIKLNRKAEKEFHRKDGIFDSESDETYEEHVKEDRHSYKPKSKLSLLSKKRDEKLGKSND